MKKVLKFILAELIFLGGILGMASFIGWIMTFDIPVPVLIVGFCFLLYQILRRI